MPHAGPDKAPDALFGAFSGTSHSGLEILPQTLSGIFPLGSGLHILQDLLSKPRTDKAVTEKKKSHGECTRKEST